MSLLDKINQQRAKLQRGNFNRAEKLHSERNRIRVLPSWTGDIEDQNWQQWGQHFIKDTAGNLKAVYICTRTCFEEDCAICDAIAHGAALTTDEDILNTLKDARSSRRQLVNALYLQGGKHDNPATNPVVLDLPNSVLDSILTTYVAYKEEGINVFDLDEGMDFIVTKTGTGLNTEYSVTPAPKPSKVDAKVMDKVENLVEWARQESEADKAKAVTSVRVIAGVGGSAEPPRMIAGSGSANAARPSLSKVEPEPVDADFVDVTGDPEIDDFLKDL